MCNRDRDHCDRTIDDTKQDILFDLICWRSSAWRSDHSRLPLPRTARRRSRRSVLRPDELVLSVATVGGEGKGLGQMSFAERSQVAGCRSQFASTHALQPPGSVQILVEALSRADIQLVVMPGADETGPSVDLLDITRLHQRPAHVITDRIEADDLSMRTSHETDRTPGHLAQFSFSPT